MFNDLNNANKSDHQAVDDIFAETDKTAEGGTMDKPLNSEIETRRVGLATGDELAPEATEEAANNKWFKIVIIIIILAILVLAGYLVYSKFFKASSALDLPVATPPATTENKQTATAPTGSFVNPTGSNTATNNASGSTAVIPEIPGVNAPAATSSESAASSSPVSLIDSDSDGLTDAEETSLGTNLSAVDTDNDGLSDYEEVRIYHTNPLNTDTDGDTYLDGAEVKAGYDPNAVGKKLPGAATSPAATK